MLYIKATFWVDAWTNVSTEIPICELPMLKPGPSLEGLPILKDFFFNYLWPLQFWYPNEGPKLTYLFLKTSTKTKNTLDISGANQFLLTHTLENVVCVVSTRKKVELCTIRSSIFTRQSWKEMSNSTLRFLTPPPLIKVGDIIMKITMDHRRRPVLKEISIFQPFQT